MSILSTYILQEKSNLLSIAEQINHIDDSNLNIHTSYSRGKSQYYYYKEGGKRIYLPKKEWNIASCSFTNEYYTKLQKEIEHRGNMLNTIQEYSELSSLHSIYEGLAKGKKELVDALTMSDEEYIKLWYENNPGGQNEYPFEGNYYTLKDEQVRSRVEQSIADRLNYYQRPYVYESNFYFSDGTFVSSDFKVLNVRERRTWIWEHFGKMGDVDYSTKTVKKINKYANEGIYIGDGLIATFEAEMKDYDSRMINTLIEKYLI